MRLLNVDTIAEARGKLLENAADNLNALISAQVSSASDELNS